MKRILVITMMVVCFLGMVSIANAKSFFNVVRPYISVGPAYVLDMKGYGKENLGDIKSKPIGYDLRAGINIFPYLAIEGEYLESKGFKGTITTVNTSNLYSDLLIVNWDDDFKVTVTNLKLRYPFKEKGMKIIPFLTVGEGYMDITFRGDYEYKIIPLNLSFTGSLNSAASYPCTKTGGGVDVEIKHFHISLEYSYFKIRTTEITENGYNAYVLMSRIGYKF